jgi:hypothetical protein
MSDAIDNKAVIEQQPIDEKNAVGPRDLEEIPIDALPKSRWERSWPVIACGAGLFSDGYLNGVSFCFQSIYYVSTN